MGMWLKKTKGVWDSLPANQPIVQDDGTAQPYDILEKWTRAELVEIGVYWADEPAPPPTIDHFWTGKWSVQVTGQTATMTREYAAPSLQTVKDGVQADINIYRDALIDGGYWYAGHRMQSRASDRENIAAVGGDAALALMRGAQPGDYKWAGLPGNLDFAWICEDNSVVPMDAQTTRGMYVTGAQLKQAWTFFARQLKDQVAQCATLEAVRAIDITEGWPPAGQVPAGVVDPKPTVGSRPFAGGGGFRGAQ